MKKLIAGMIVFGSIWGFLECSLGDWLHQYNMSALMVVAAVFLMAVTRRMFAQPGMQMGMALIAAILRHFNPIGGACLVCASIAIVVQGLAFELIWAIPWHKYQSMTMKASMGVVSFYTIAAVSYLATQIFTPLLTATPHLSDLAGVMPKIFAHAFIAGLAGAVALPVAHTEITIHLNDRFYYPVAAAVTAVCWMAVIAGV